MYDFNILANRDQLADTISGAIANLQTTQNRHGAWEECFDTGVMSDAQTVISLYLLGVSNRQWTDPILHKIESSQRENGSWGVYPGDEGDLSTTVECYYALALKGRWASRPCQQALAKNFIRRRGGLHQCRNLTKMFLAVGGEIPWSWLPSPKTYSWFFAKFTPVHIWNVVMFTRLHIPPMLVLSSKRYVSEFVSELVLQDLLHRRSQTASTTSPTKEWGRWTRGRMTRCLQMMLAEREMDGTAAGYHSSTFLLLLALRALGYPTSSSEIQKPLQAMRRNLYELDGRSVVAHQQTCNAHVWNTALALQAFEEAGVGKDSVVLRKGISYLLSRQHSGVGDWLMKSEVQPGGWGFSSNNTLHPDTDDTVSSLKALYPLAHEHREVWSRGVKWLLAMQNNDGGWSAFEKDSHHQWLEWIPANDMRRSMTDPSTADITGRVIEFLIRCRVVPLDDDIIQRGLRWLIQHQENNGSWFGRWGSTYLYGSWCAVRALAAAEISSTHSVLAKTKKWILSVQNRDGGFGESCESDIKGKYVPLEPGTPTQTAWGLDTILNLMEVEESRREWLRLSRAAHAAAEWLLKSAEFGAWCEEYPTGSAFPGALHIRYHIYPKVWPLMALCHYQRVMESTVGEGR